MDKKLPISATIITLNEAKNIDACLASLTFLDEVIVVDSGSTDATAEICQRYNNVHFLHQKWLGYGAQKNYAATHTSQPWILNIDADERVTTSLQKKLYALDYSGTKVDVYSICRLNHFCGKLIKHGGWYPDAQKRLYQKSSAKFNERAVHEAVLGQLANETLAEALEHYTYTSLSDYIERMNRYSSLAAQQFKKDCRNVRLSDIYLRPIFTFLKMYFIKRGFLDGYAGLTLATLYSFYTYSKYLKASGRFPDE